jgi:16S rRNA (cytosine1402-N4)-methyltransferase
MHTSVFLEEAIEALNVQNDGRYIDATYGVGGHTREITKRGGIVLALDLDEKHIQHGSTDALQLVHGNYADIQHVAKMNTFIPVDGVLFDLGLSMDQLTAGGKGLSFKNLSEPLDMRISFADVTAADILNEGSEEELNELFMKYSEEIHSKEIARAITLERRNKRIDTVEDLVSVISKVLEKKKAKHAFEGTAARIFQALRILVNNEFNNITKGLDGSLQIVKPGGRIVIITFHSLEDRIVKMFIRSHKSEVTDEKINVAKKRELRSFERSATLRIIIKK